jgi:hypothetical protein
MSGLLGGTVDLTGEQRPLLPSSEVDTSVNDLQNQLENLIGSSAVYRRVPKTIITKAASA